MSVVVTGATSFVGRSLVSSLRSRGLTVRAVVKPDSNPDTVSRLRSLGAIVTVADVTDEASLVAAMRGAGVIYHCARVGLRSTADEAEKINLVGTENSLSAAKRSGARRFIFLSSESVTRGHEARSYVDEKVPHPPGFLDFCSQTTALAEDLVLAASGDEIDTVALRPGLLWGPDDTVTLPALAAMVRNRTFWWVKAGRSLIATTYVSNLVDAMLCASTAPDAGSKVYYITDDERVSYRDFVTRYLSTVSLTPPERSAPYPVAYAYAWWCERTQATPVVVRSEIAQTGLSSHFNVQRARTELGWAPKVTLTEGLRATQQWVTANGVEAVLRGNASPDIHVGVTG